MLLSFLKSQHLFLLQRDAVVDRKIQEFVVTKGGVICQLPQKKIDAVIAFVTSAKRALLYLLLRLGLRNVSTRIFNEQDI